MSVIHKLFGTFFQNYINFHTILRIIGIFYNLLYKITLFSNFQIFFKYGTFLFLYYDREGAINKKVRDSVRSGTLYGHSLRTNI